MKTDLKSYGHGLEKITFIHTFEGIRRDSRALKRFPFAPFPPYSLSTSPPPPAPKTYSLKPTHHAPENLENPSPSLPIHNNPPINLLQFPNPPLHTLLLPPQSLLPP